MGWICGHHKPTVIPDGEPCASCNPPQTRRDEAGKPVTVKPGTRGRAWSVVELAEQKAAYEAKGGTWGLNPTGGEK